MMLTRRFSRTKRASELSASVIQLQTELRRAAEATNPTPAQQALLALGAGRGRKPFSAPPQSAQRVDRRARPHDNPTLCDNLISASTPPFSANQFWQNWGIIDIASLTSVETGLLNTALLFAPTSPYEISSAIQQAEADGKTIRALGSGWGFSDVAIPQETPISLAEAAFAAWGATETSYGYAILPNNISSNSNHLQTTLLPQILLPDVDQSSLFFVEAGITLASLNTLLDSQSPPVALATLGGSAGQTLAGAISTGTHGMDFDRPPLADYVQAIYLIGAGGTHHWIEPATAITSPASIQTVFPCIAAANCHYDDDMFYATLVSMGCMGVIYAVVIKVVPQFLLTQFNIWSTWEALKAENAATVEQIFPDFTEFLWNSEYSTCQALQIIVNPIRNDDGTHNACATTRVGIPLSAAAPGLMLPSGVQPGNLGSAISDIVGPDILAALENAPGETFSVISLLTLAIFFGQVEVNIDDPIGSINSLISFAELYGYPFIVRAIIDLVMQNAYPQYQAAGPQIDLGYNVMAGGNAFGGITFGAFQVTSMEVGFSWEQAIAFVNAALQYFDQAVSENIYPAGYVSLRACGPTRATMGMERAGSGHFPDVTGMVEISLIGNENDYTMIAALEDLALQYNGYLHWGESNGHLDAATVAAQYPALPAFKTAQQTLGGATFTNLFMQRCGLV